MPQPLERDESERRRRRSGPVEQEGCGDDAL